MWEKVLIKIKLVVKNCKKSIFLSAKLVLEAMPDKKLHKFYHVGNILRLEGNYIITRKTQICFAICDR